MDIFLNRHGDSAQRLEVQRTIREPPLDWDVKVACLGKEVGEESGKLDGDMGNRRLCVSRLVFKYLFAHG